MSADTSCFPCDPVIPAQTPSLVYGGMSSVFTFTSCLFSTLVYVLYILYSFYLPRIQPRGGHWQGCFFEVIVRREKIKADWPRHDVLSEAHAIQAPAKASFFKWERGPIQQLHKQPGRQTVEGKRDKRRQMQNREDLLNENLRKGLLLKGLKSIVQKRTNPCNVNLSGLIPLL